jgi:hypothetical protein
VKDRQAGEGGTRERGLAGEREGLAGEREGLAGEREGLACEGWTGGCGERAREGRTGRRDWWVWDRERPVREGEGLVGGRGRDKRERTSR